MFERCLYFNINALARRVNGVWEEAFREFGLSPSHAYLLRVVLANPGLSPKQIGEELKIEKSTVTRFLDAMEKAGFVSRKKSASGDGREQRIVPTRKAQNIALALEAKGNGLYQAMLDTLGNQRLKELVGELREVRTMLK